MKKLLSWYFSGLRSHFISVGYSGMDDEADIIALMIGSLSFSFHIMTILIIWMEHTFFLNYYKTAGIITWLTSGLFNYFYIIKSKEYETKRLCKYTLKERLYCIVYVLISGALMLYVSAP